MVSTRLDKDSTSQMERATETPPAPPTPSVMQLAMPNCGTDAARDPIRLMMEIAENQELSPSDRAYLIQLAQERFKNRRRMAYICLITLVASIVCLFVGAFVEGIFGKKVLSVIAEHSDLFVWADFFLTTIIGAYYGVSAWRPSS